MKLDRNFLIKSSRNPVTLHSRRQTAGSPEDQANPFGEPFSGESARWCWTGWTVMLIQKQDKRPRKTPLRLSIILVGFRDSQHWAIMFTITKAVQSPTKPKQLYKLFFIAQWLKPPWWRWLPTSLPVVFGKPSRSLSTSSGFLGRKISPMVNESSWDIFATERKAENWML